MVGDWASDSAHAVSVRSAPPTIAITSCRHTSEVPGHIRRGRLGSEELGHERNGGPASKIGERALLDHPATAHESDRGTEDERFPDVMGDDDDGLSELAD